MLGGLLQAQTGSQPVRWNAQYTQIYFDDVSTVSPTLGPGFVLGPAGSLTQAASEVIDGTASIKGFYSGTNSFTPYLFTDATKIAFTPGRTYRITFRYKILTTPDKGFEVLFYSPTGGAAGNFLPSVAVTGTAGATGTATLTNTLGQYSDYQARWNVIGTGAIAIDDIQITDTESGLVVAGENAEATTPNVGSGLQLINGASITTDSTLVVGGKASVSLNSNYGGIATNPAVVQLSGNTTYIVEFQYRILNPGTDPVMMNLYLFPANLNDPQSMIQMRQPLRNSGATGTFSAGAQTAGASSYVLYLTTTATSSLVVSDIKILRQDAITTGTPPANWLAITKLPFPRIGRYIFADANSTAVNPLDGIPSLTYTQPELEKRLAFADVIVGPEPHLQAQAPEFIRNVHQLNPNTIFLPYRIAEEQGLRSPPYAGNVDPEYAFFSSLSGDWYARDTSGAYIEEVGYPGLRIMNISPFCPVVNGQTFTSAMLSWLGNTVFPTGLWDGIFFDNLFGRINGHIAGSNDPSRLNYDWNRNGLRDETPASSSDMARQAATQMLRDLQGTTGGLQLVIGNAGNLPELALAPYVNGYVFEGFNNAWNGLELNTAPQNPAMWRGFLDAYRTLESSARAPVIDVMEGGGGLATPISTGGQITPTPADFQRHRIAMTSALLGNGFYGYDLVGNLTTPYWYDEYSVDGTGTAVENLKAKGYLGEAVGNATQSTDAGILVFSENFEGTTVPNSFFAGAGVSGATLSVSQSASDVISGSGSLVLSNTDHSTLSFPTASMVPGAVPFVAGNMYLVVFDWRVLGTVDGALSVDLGDGVPVYTLQGIVTGDSGTAVFPLAWPSSGTPHLRFGFLSGGRVAIDNIRVFQGGVGPWRRDFENGFALVNPYLTPYTFTSDQIAGALHRTGVHRIKGTQAPDVNNGQTVSGTLTLQPFDGIILLADHIDAASVVRPQTGWWWDPKLSGTGFFIENGGKSGQGIFVGGFLYDAAGNPTWLASTGSMTGPAYTSTWLKVSGGQTLLGSYQAPSTAQAGNLSITFSDSTHGVMTRPDGTQINLQRFSFTSSATPTPPEPGMPQNGWWWAGSSLSGTGYGIEIQGLSVFIVAYVYDEAGNPVWYLATGSLTSPTSYSGTWDVYAGGPQLTSPEGTFAAHKVTSATPMTLTFSDATHGTLTMGSVTIPIVRFQEF